MIVDKLIEQALQIPHENKIKDIRAGLGYTCVLLDNDACGLAYTFRNELGNCCGILDEAGSLIGVNVDDIIPWAKDGNRLKASIGLAAVNSLINDPSKNWDTGNVLSELKISSDDTFGMVGAFMPILSKVKTMTENIYVFEQHVPENSGFYPEKDIPLYLPKCDVIVITATSIINHTIDNILPYCDNAKEICLVGPSTPLCPEVLKRYKITLLAGSVVKNSDKVLQILSQGGGTMSLKPYVDQVLLRL